MYNIEKNSKFVIDLPLQNNNPSEWYGLWEASPIWKFVKWIHMSLFHLFKHDMLYYMTL